MLIGRFIVSLPRESKNDEITWFSEKTGTKCQWIWEGDTDELAQIKITIAVALRDP